MRHAILLIGLPLSGKGTVSNILCELRPNIFHFSLGDEIKNIIKHKSKLGQQFEKILKNGELLDIKTTLTLLDLFLPIDTEFTLFDGFPRTLEQFKCVSDTLNYDKISVVLIEAEIQILIERLKTRKYCEYCHYTELNSITCKQCKHVMVTRIDDNEITFAKRLQIQGEKQNELLNHILSFKKGITIHKILNNSNDINTLKKCMIILSEELFSLR